MIIIKMLAILIQFTLVPIVFGRLITYRVKASEHKKPIEIYIVGYFGSLGLFFIISCVLTWWQNFSMIREAVSGAFEYLCWTYSIAVVFVFVLEIVIERAEIILVLKKIANIKECVRNLFCDIKAGNFACIYGMIFFVVLLIQLFFSYRYEVNEWSYDDFDYVVISQDDISYNMLSNVSVVSGETPFTEPKRCATSWPAYIAYLSQISGFEVTTIAHTILPVVLLIMAYIVFYYMASFLFDELENRLIFLSILGVLFSFGNFSHYSLAFRLLCTLWQGKAVLCAIMLPFLLVYLPKIFEKKVDIANMLPVFFISMGACSLTTMTMLLFSMELVIIAIVMCIYHRRIIGIPIVIAGLSASFIQLVFYRLITMLLIEQQTWGKIWFGTNS